MESNHLSHESRCCGTPGIAWAGLEIGGWKVEGWKVGWERVRGKKVEVGWWSLKAGIQNKSQAIGVAKSIPRISLTRSCPCYVTCPTFLTRPV